MTSKSYPNLKKRKFFVKILLVKKLTFCEVPRSVGEGNEAFLIRVWKPLPSIHILKSWGWRWYVTGQSGQYLLAVGLTVTNGIRARFWVVCQRGRWVPKGDGLWGLTLVGEGNKAFLIRVWKPLSSTCVLKLWGWRWHVTGQSRQYLLAGGLGCY